MSENGFEFFHIYIHQPFPLLGSVSGGESHVGVPVPWETAPPFHSRGFDMGLGDLPPGPDFPALGLLSLHEGLVLGIDQGIILEEEGPGKAVSVQKLRLFQRGLIQDFAGIAGVPWLHQADEIDDIDYPWGIFSYQVFFLLFKYSPEGVADRMVRFLYPDGAVIHLLRRSSPLDGHESPSRLNRTAFLAALVAGIRVAVAIAEDTA